MIARDLVGWLVGEFDSVTPIYLARYVVHTRLLSRAEEVQAIGCILDHPDRRLREVSTVLVAWNASSLRAAYSYLWEYNRPLKRRAM